MYLSRHFTLEEMTRSDTAARHSLENDPGKEEKINLAFLCMHCLEPLREAWGAPIVVTSGYRSKRVNELVGGTKNSQHTKGQAADIRPVHGEDFTKLFKLANRICDYDQLLFEYNKSNGKVRCIHISCNKDISKNRHYTREKYLL